MKTMGKESPQGKGPITHHVWSLETRAITRVVQYLTPITIVVEVFK